VYVPGGGKLALMKGQTLSLGFVPLVAGGTAIYTSGPTLSRYRHPDWLGSARFSSSHNQGMYHDTAYAPYGETYAEAGEGDDSFTGANKDTYAYNPYPLYDFLEREHHPVWGRWVSPDPAGLGAVNPANPQSWNRYAYVTNNPLALTDPLGLDGNGIRYACIYGQCNAGTFEENLFGCNVDGGAVPCSVAYGLVAIGAADECPTPYCTPVGVGGVVAYPVDYQTGMAWVPAVGPGYLFDNLEDALAVGSLYAQNESLLNSGNERCGMAYGVGDQFTFTSTVEGTASTCNYNTARNLVPYGDIAMGLFHGHGIASSDFADERFSVGDIRGSIISGYTTAVATPGGRVIIYDPTQGCQMFDLGDSLGTGTKIPICP
jgi:RHS repeat-associated protein